MPIKKMLSSWLKSEPKQKTSGVSEDVLRELEDEQSRLSVEIESLLRSYDSRTRNLARRLTSLDAEDRPNRSIKDIREDQKKLWRLIRRLQAGERRDKALEREYQEWMSREDSGLASSHPDHPVSRAEIVASELRLRGIDPSSLIESNAGSMYQGSAQDVDPFAGLEDAWDEDEDAGVLEELEEESSVSIEAPAWEGADEQALLAELDALSCELSKMVNQEDSYRNQKEVMEMLKDLRHYHAHLRRHDRSKGIRRYRVLLGHPMFR